MSGITNSKDLLKRIKDIESSKGRSDPESLALKLMELGKLVKEIPQMSMGLIETEPDFRSAETAYRELYSALELSHGFEMPSTRDLSPQLTGYRFQL